MTRPFGSQFNDRGPKTQLTHLADVVPPRSDDPSQTYGWRNGRLFFVDRPFPWSDGESLGEALTCAGFCRHPSIQLGEDFESVQLKVHVRPGGCTTAPHWIADLTISDVTHLVWIDEVDDLLDILKHIAPTIAAVAMLSDRQERLADERRVEAEMRQPKRDIWG